ncbi:porin family protein [uncultured Dokdonia sp.]|uniref:porin family protein n=1 Tax=uncultured Dokdonia sp. TaxID=575653 RepID=UPI0030EF9E03|tara:strand:+ start:275810 stop:276415 length:606 start_codon:yes stop_codon:yes gene_type:complete
MKKPLFFFTGLFLLSFFSINAQVTSGFKAGVNFADVNGLSFDNDGSSAAERIENQLDGKRTSYFVGFLVDIPISEKLSFMPEFIFSQQGKNLESFRLDYLNLPLGLKLNLSNLYINAGPQVGVKVWDPNKSGIFSNFEASAFGGLGYIFDSNIFIEARYTYGLTDIFQDNNNFTFDNAGETRFSGLEGKNAVIQLGIGYRL